MSDTNELPTHIITATFEVPKNMTEATMHELLCKAIHEDDTESFKTLNDNVIDIDVQAAPTSYYAVHMNQDYTQVLAVLCRTTYDSQDCDRPWCLYEAEGFEYVAFDEHEEALRVINAITSTFVRLRHKVPYFRVLTNEELHDLVTP